MTYITCYYKLNWGPTINPTSVTKLEYSLADL